jgi:hypothetical protein
MVRAASFLLCVPSCEFGRRKENVPAGVKPLEWVLLCDAPVSEFATPHQCVLQYATRWLIEEFHKVLKRGLAWSGLGVERLQLKTASRLFAAIALLSVVAVRLVDLREHLRRDAERPAPQCGLEPLELEVLRLQSRRPLESAQDVALALGRLGGHLNRAGDGQPGWQVLWRGMHHLQTLVEGSAHSQQTSAGIWVRTSPSHRDGAK